MSHPDASDHPALQLIPARNAASPEAVSLTTTILSGDISLDAAIPLVAAHFLTEPRVGAVTASSTNFTPDDESAWTRLGERAWVREWLAPGSTLSIVPSHGAGPEAALTMPWLSPRARAGIVALTDTALLPEEAAQDRRELTDLGVRSLIGSTYNAEGVMFGSMSLGSAVAGPWPVGLFADLQLLNAAITSRLSLTHARQAMARTIASAAEARVAHQQLMASIGHELRTPLATVIGNTEMMMSEVGPDTPETLTVALRTDGQRVLRACDQLVAVVDSLLDAGRSLSGADTRAHVSVAEAIADVLHWQRTPARSAQVSVTSSVEPSVTVWAHGSAVRQVLTNLVSNAINHNRPGGSVQLSTEQLRGEAGEDRLRIIVRDDGLGLTPDQLSHAFEPFVRFAVGDTKGIGLGLPMCRSIAERDGGTVRGESTPGVGSAFWLELPTSRPHDT